MHGINSLELPLLDGLGVNNRYGLMSRVPVSILTVLRDVPELLCLTSSTQSCVNLY